MLLTTRRTMKRKKITSLLTCELRLSLPATTILSLTTPQLTMLQKYSILATRASVTLCEVLIGSLLITAIFDLCGQDTRLYRSLEHYHRHTPTTSTTRSIASVIPEPPQTKTRTNTISGALQAGGGEGLFQRARPHPVLDRPSWAVSQPQKARS